MPLGTFGANLYLLVFNVLDQSLTMALEGFPNRRGGQRYAANRHQDGTHLLKGYSSTQPNHLLTETRTKPSAIQFPALIQGEKIPVYIPDSNNVLALSLPPRCVSVTTSSSSLYNAFYCHISDTPHSLGRAYFGS